MIHVQMDLKIKLFFSFENKVQQWLFDICMYAKLMANIIC